MDAVSRAMATQYPEIKDWGIRLVTFYRLFVGTQLRRRCSCCSAASRACCSSRARTSRICCSAARSRASARWPCAPRSARAAARLLQQLLVESLVLASIGGILGLVVASWAVRLINVGLPAGVLPFPTVSMDSTVVLFALGVTLLTGLLFGLAPAWSMAKTELTRSLKQADRSSAGKGRALVRNGLAAAELALATMLLVGAGLLGRSLLALQRVDVGFQPDHLLTFQLSPPVSNTRSTARRRSSTSRCSSR